MTALGNNTSMVVLAQRGRMEFNSQFIELRAKVGTMLGYFKTQNSFGYKLAVLRYKGFWMSFVITVLILLFLSSRIEQPLPGLTRIELVVGCQMNLFDTRLQPAFTVTLDCPSVDSIRLWPFPILLEWDENPKFPPGSKESRIMNQTETNQNKNLNKG